MPRSIRLLFALIMSTLALSGCREAGPTAPPAELDLRSLPNTIDAQTARSLQGRDDVVLFDVREPVEYDAGHIAGAKLIPLGQVPSRMAEIPKDKTVILTCRSGNRSGQAADFLRQQGWKNVHNMAGGIVAWQHAGLPLEK